MSGLFFSEFSESDNLETFLDFETLHACKKTLWFSAGVNVSLLTVSSSESSPPISTGVAGCGCGCGVGCGVAWGNGIGCRVGCVVCCCFEIVFLIFYPKYYVYLVDLIVFWLIQARGLFDS